MGSVSMGSAGWTSALQQQQKRGVCTGADGALASSSCWQPAVWVAGVRKGGIRPRTFRCGEAWVQG